MSGIRHRWRRRGSRRRCGAGSRCGRIGRDRLQRQARYAEHTGRRGQRRCRERCELGPGSPSAGTDHETEEQQTQRCGERPLEAFDGDLLLQKREIVFRQRTDRARQDFFQPLGLHAQRLVKAATGRGDGFEPRFVEA